MRDSIAIPRRIIIASMSCLLLLLMTNAAEQPAYGYVDPGSGLLVMQLITSSLAAGLFYFRRKLRHLFRVREREAAPPRDLFKDTHR